MKENKALKLLYWSGLCIAFLGIIQLSTELNLLRLSNLRYLVILCLATALLMVPSYFKPKRVWRNALQFNLFLVGALLSMLMVLSYVSQELQVYRVSEVIQCFIPLIYSLIIYLPITNILQSIRKSEPIEPYSANAIQKISIVSLDLSRREKEVIQLALLDLSNKQIAEKLYIQESTVKKHLQNIYKKAQCMDRTELIKKYSM